MKELGVAVVGAGWAGWRYAQVFRRMPDVKVRVICDIREDVAQTLAADIGADWCTDFEAAMDRPDVEAVGICTADSEHLYPCLSAARHGKHILVEKPIATTIADAQQIIEAARQASVTLMVGHVLHFDPRWQGARAAIAAGEIGEVLSIYTRRNAPVTSQERLRGRVSLPLFLGVHDYDAMRWFVGAEVTRVYAQSRFGYWMARGYEVEDVTFAVLNFANGALGVSELSWCLPAGIQSSDWRVDVTGDRGSIHITNSPNLVKVNEQRSTAIDVLFTPTLYGNVVGDFLYELRHFVDCIRQGTPPLVTGEDGLAALRIALAVEESARKGSPVDISVPA